MNSCHVPSYCPISGVVVIALSDLNTILLVRRTGWSFARKKWSPTFWRRSYVWTKKCCRTGVTKESVLSHSSTILRNSCRRRLEKNRIISSLACALPFLPTNLIRTLFRHSKRCVLYYRSTRRSTSTRGTRALLTSAKWRWASLLPFMCIHGGSHHSHSVTFNFYSFRWFRGKWWTRAQFWSSLSKSVSITVLIIHWCKRLHWRNRVLTRSGSQTSLPLHHAVLLSVFICDVFQAYMINVVKNANGKVVQGDLVSWFDVLCKRTSWASHRLWCLLSSPHWFLLQSSPVRVQHVWVMCRDMEELNPAIAWKLLEAHMQETPLAMWKEKRVSVDEHDHPLPPSSTRLLEYFEMSTVFFRVVP